MALAMHEDIAGNQVGRTLDHASRPRLRDRIRKISGYFVVGLGLLATVTWMALLSWLLYRLVTLLV